MKKQHKAFWDLVKKSDKPLLHLAIEENNLVLIKELLESGVRVDSVDNQGEGALFSVANWQNVDEAIELFELFKHHGYDFTQKNVNGLLLSSFILQSFPKEVLQHIFDYMYQEGWPFDIYQGAKRPYHSSRALYALVLNVKLNSEQIQAILVDSVTKENYSHIPLDAIATIVTDKEELTQDVFFKIAEKIDINNWTVQIAPLKDDLKGYLLVQDLFSFSGHMLNYAWKKLYTQTEYYTLDTYAKDLKNPISLQKKETQIIQRIFNKTNLNEAPKFIYDFLASLPIQEFLFDLNRVNLNQEFDYYRLGGKKQNLHHVLHHIYKDKYNFKNVKLLYQLLETELFDIYTLKNDSIELFDNSFIARIFRDMAYLNIHSKNTKQENVQSKNYYDLVFFICQHYTIDLSHQDKYHKSLADYISCFNEKERHSIEQAIFEFSLKDKNIQAIKKIKI